MAGGWAVFWNELLDGAPPGRHRRIAAVATRVGALLTASTGTARWFAGALARWRPGPLSRRSAQDLDRGDVPPPGTGRDLDLVDGVARRGSARRPVGAHAAAGRRCCTPAGWPDRDRDRGRRRGRPPPPGWPRPRRWPGRPPPRRRPGRRRPPPGWPAGPTASRRSSAGRSPVARSSAAGCRGRSRRGGGRGSRAGGRRGARRSRRPQPDTGQTQGPTPSRLPPDPTGPGTAARALTAPIVADREPRPQPTRPTSLHRTR